MYFDMMEFSYTSEDIRPVRPPQYQVFINFRGAELREGFLRTLVDALRAEQVNVFVDEDEVRGEDLTRLYGRIEESRIAVTIFSEMYSNSEWCLNELVRIKKCMDRGKIRVFPIFFNVEARDVKKLEGNFGRNLRELEERYHNQERTKKEWRKALELVSGKHGLPADLSRLTSILWISRYLYKMEFAKLITKKVKEMLEDVSRREEEEIRTREERAEARRNSWLGKTKALILSVVPRGVMVFLMITFVAHYLLWFICGILYYTGSFASQSKSNGTGRWIHDDRVVIL